MITKFLIALGALAPSLGQAACQNPSPAKAGSIQGSFAVPFSKWEGWAQAADKMPDEPYKGKWQAPTTPPFVEMCGLAGAVSGFCINNNVLSPANSGLGPVDPTDRLNFVRFYGVHYNMVTSADQILQQYYSPAYHGPRGRSSGPDILNTLVARIRYRLYVDLTSVNCLQANASSQSAATGLKSVSVELQRQLKLLDYLFPDAALWEMLLMEGGIMT